MQTIVSEGRSRVKKGGPTNDSGLPINISILILMLTLKSIKMRETAINSLKTSLNISIPPTTKLETNFTKSLKRMDPFHPQLTCTKISVHSMQHRTLQ